MTEQWKELKETIVELRDNDGIGTQQEVCKFLANLMDVLENQIQEPRTVIYSGDGYADGHMVYDMAECPNCGYKYEEDDKDWKEPFCPHCGRALKWGSEDEK